MRTLTAKVPSATPSLVFTAENDPNHLLGRPNGYTSKASFTDSRITGDDLVAAHPATSAPAARSRCSRTPTAPRAASGTSAASKKRPNTGHRVRLPHRIRPRTDLRQTHPRPGWRVQGGAGPVVSAAAAEAPGLAQTPRRRSRSSRPYFLRTDLRLTSRRWPNTQPRRTAFLPIAKLNGLALYRKFGLH